MAEATQLMFKHAEVVTALIKQQGLHEGIWALTVHFGLGAVNAGQSPDGSDANPAAVIPVLGIGLQRADAASNIAVDAAIVNPA